MTSKTNSDIALGDVRATSYDAATANVHGYVGTIDDALAQIRAEPDVARPYWPLNISRERFELLGFLGVLNLPPRLLGGKEDDTVEYGAPEQPVEPGFYTLAYAQKHFPSNFKVRS